MMNGMRRRLAAYLFAGLLLISLAASMLATLVKANPYGLGIPVPLDPITDKPTINLLSPNNGTIAGENVSIAFSLDIPSSWYWQLNPLSGIDVFIGTITEVTCALDEKQVLDNSTEIGGFCGKPEWGSHADFTNITSSPVYSVPACGLASGLHSVSVNVSAYTAWMTSPNEFNTSYCYYDMFTSANFAFRSGCPALSSSVLEFAAWFIMPVALAIAMAVAIRAIKRSRIKKGAIKI